MSPYCYLGNLEYPILIISFYKDGIFVMYETQFHSD